MKYLRLFEEFNTEKRYDFGDTISDIPGSDPSIVIQVMVNGEPQSVMARHDIKDNQGNGVFTSTDIPYHRKGESYSSILKLLRLPINSQSGSFGGWRLPNMSEVSIMRDMYKSGKWSFTRYEEPLYLYSVSDGREFQELEPGKKLQYQLDNVNDLRYMNFVTGESLTEDETSYNHCIRLVYDLFTYKYSDQTKDFVKHPR